MSVRNPEDSQKEDVQNKVLQPSEDTLNEETHNPAAPEHRAAVHKTHHDEALKTKVELDRVEVYLRGPTAFSA